MNILEIFQTPEFGTVRTVIREDAPWFVAADVCRILRLGCGQGVGICTA